MTVPRGFTSVELGTINDPSELLAMARSFEPSLRLTERTATLDRLEQLLDSGAAPPAPPGRSWRLELIAERAIDAAANVRLDEAAALAERVLEQPGTASPIAIARARLAHGRSLAWTGTDEASRQGDLVLAQAGEEFAALGEQEWQGFTSFWRGYAVYYQTGDLRRAAELIEEALAILAPDSPRRSTVLNFYADVLTELGDWEAAERALAAASEAAEHEGELMSRSYTAWSEARLASARGDAFATERKLREVEREATDWFDTHIGLAFLTDAVQLLDRVGLSAEATAYLERARERSADDEAVRQAEAMVLARSGDPWQALRCLQALVRGDWLEKRLVWRHTLLSAWATFRAGRDGAGELAARALAQAQASGGPGIATAGEPDIVRALAPLAERAGSGIARELMLDGRSLVVRLFGTPSVARADGSAVELPAGKPGELVRMLALHEHGLPTDVVLEAFFPDVPLPAARQRLRQVLTRLRASAGEVVIRDGEMLRLAPAWVDAREFAVASDRVRATDGPRSVRLAYTALALWDGPFLPTDPYASWAEEIRYHLEYRHVAMLDLVAADAATRGSHQEALTALDAAAAADPGDESRYLAIAEQLLALGRHGTAQYLAQRAIGGPRRTGTPSDESLTPPDESLTPPADSLTPPAAAARAASADPAAETR